MTAARDGLPDRPLPVGASAPGFSARSQHGETVSPDDLAGSPSLVMFYPFAFSRVCGSELAELHARREEFEGTGARVLTISCDPMHALRAYAEALAENSAQQSRRSVSFDLLSDFWPHGEIASAFGVFDAGRGAAARTSFLLDAQLTVRHVQQAELSERRDLDETLRVLKTLS